MAGIKAFLVLPVAAFHFAIVPRRIGADELVADTELRGGAFKEGGKVTLGVGETVGEFKPVISLDAFHPNAPAGVPFHQLFQEIGRGIGGLLWIGGQEAQTGELINGGVLVQTQFRVCDTTTRNHLHIHLDPLAGIGHLLIGLGFVCLFLFCGRKHTQFPHHSE